MAERGTVIAVHDRFPVTEGHLLILPERHIPDWFSMTARERSDADGCGA
jgi:diadenosine tetraphosphate (Ap4A) HIT family hydrolase